MDKLIKYYGDYDENGRLYRDNAHQIEWLTTIHYLKKYLPKGAAIFDCCAGTGIYSFWLAENGFEVTAGDLMQKHADIIRSSKKAHLLKDILTCNVLDMSAQKDQGFDVVLCMGAYYHLHKESDRIRAVKECLRVLKDNGILVLAYINRNAVFLNHFSNDPVKTVLTDDVMHDGRNDVFYASGFCEVESLIKSLGHEAIADVGVDGFMYPLINQINALNDLQFQKYMKYHLETCEMQSIIGNSMHGLYFAKKKS